MPTEVVTQLLRSAPYFPVPDVATSVAYYERVLEFRPEYVAGTPPEFAILSRDGLAVMLRRIPAPAVISPNERQGGTWDVFFWVRDARALHAELLSRGATVVYGPMVQTAYNMEEFAVRDPDGTSSASARRSPESARARAGGLRAPEGSRRDSGCTDRRRARGR